MDKNNRSTKTWTYLHGPLVGFMFTEWRFKPGGLKNMQTCVMYWYQDVHSALCRRQETGESKRLTLLHCSFEFLSFLHPSRTEGGNTVTFANVPQELGILTCGKDAASEDSRLREIPSGRFLAGS